MAIYHFNARIIGRSEGRSSVSAAAYRSGSLLMDDRTGIRHDYRRKLGVDYGVILCPVNAPDWAKDRYQLWNAIEAIEKRKDAQLCREIEVALPQELNLSEMKILIETFAQAEFVEKGMIADINIHHAESENPHAHILLSTRLLSCEGFGGKNRDWNQRNLLDHWRESWETHVNDALALSGHDVRVDHRSLEVQGIKRLPQIHLGAKVIAMEERGQETERGTRALEIEKINKELQSLTAYREAIGHEITIEIAEGTKRGGIGDGNRAFSASNGAFGGRNPSNFEGTSGFTRATASNLGSNAKENGRLLAEIGAGEPALPAGDDSSESRDEMAVLVDYPLRFADSYGGSYARIMDLAGSSSGYSEGGNMVGAETQPLDRGYLAVRRQLKGMGCASFEVGIRDREGKMLIRSWSNDEVLKAIPWLKRENAKGSDIYVRPAGLQNQGLVLLDDLNQSKIADLKASGLTPAVVVETSPQNFQAWIRVSADVLDREKATQLSQTLALTFGADPNSADWRHFGRLAGFTNRKPEHVAASGHYPWVLCHEASGKLSARGGEILNILESSFSEKQEKFKTSSKAFFLTQKTRTTLDATNAYQNHLERLKTAFKTFYDLSKIDYLICSEMIKQGYDEKSLQNALKNCSPAILERKVGHVEDYCERTVKAAFANPRVQNYLKKRGNLGLDFGD